MLSEFSENLLNYTATRFEQQMLKIAATKEWENVKPAPIKNGIVSHRRLQDLATDTVASPPGGSVKATFQPYVTCQLRRGKNFIGGNIPKNFVKNLFNWQSCCKKCFQRTDCIAWTINKGSDNSKRGCWLKGKGYYSKGAGNFLSGKMNVVGRE